MTCLLVTEANCRTLLDGLRLDVALVKSTVAGVRDRVGRGLLMVEYRVLNAALWQMKLLMDARLKQPMAGSCYL